MGKSDAPPDFDYSPQDYASFLAAFFRRKQHPAGAHHRGKHRHAPALFFAAAHPHRVDRVIVGDGPGAYRPEFRGLPVSALPHRFWSRVVIPLIALAPMISLRRTFRYCGGPIAAPELCHDHVVNFRRPAVVRRVFASILPAMQDLELQLSSIASDVLVIGGEQDRLIARGTANVVHQALPRSELVVVPAAGHYLHVDKPRIFIDHTIT